MFICFILQKYSFSSSFIPVWKKVENLPVFFMDFLLFIPENSIYLFSNTKQLFLFRKKLEVIRIMEQEYREEITIEEDKQKYGVPMLEKGLDLLELLAEYPLGLTVQEVVAVLNHSKTSTYRIMKSLEERGYIRKREETNQYLLSPKFLRLGLAALGESNIVECSLEYMRKLRDRLREAVMLGVLVGNEVVLLEQVLGSHRFSFILTPGTHFGLHASAPGKALLAFLEEKEREEILKTLEYEIFNLHTIKNEAELRRELQSVRASGYAVDREEEMNGVHCVAAPVFNQFGRVVATIWTSGPSGRLTQEMFPEAGKEVMEAARAVSADLGYYL